jgi:hypothetical protein
MAIRWDIRSLDRSGRFYFGKVGKVELKSYGFVFNSKGEIDLNKSNVDVDEIADRDDYDQVMEMGISVKVGIFDSFQYIIENLFEYETENINYNPRKVEIEEEEQKDWRKLKPGYYIQYTRLGKHYNGGEIAVSPADFDSSKLKLSVYRLNFPAEVERYGDIDDLILTDMEYDNDGGGDFLDEFDTRDYLDEDIVLIKIFKTADTREIAWEEVWRTHREWGPL